MSRILDWLERETGLVSAWNRFWLQPLPRGVGWAHTLGALTLLCLAVLFLTGAVLMFYYSPTPDQAYASVQYLEHQLPFGRFIRALHYWSARLIVPLMVLHLLRVFIWGAYKKPRQMIWVIGVFFFLLIVGFGLTGYALPWDQKAYWGTSVRLQIAESIPLIGGAIASFLKGGPELGSLTLMRFYVLHCFLFPLLTVVAVVIHIRQVHHLGVAPPWARVDQVDLFPRDQTLHPDQTARISLLAVLLTILLVYLASRYPAPLETRANPSDTAYRPHPDLYVLWLHELTKLFPPHLEFIASFLIPTLLLMALFLVPFVEKNPERALSKRIPVVSTGLLITFAIVLLNLKGLKALPREEPLTALEKHGQEIFVELKCYTCHGINGGGGPVGPDLGLGGKRDPEKVRAILKNPGSFNAHTVMPSYDLPEEKMTALVAYIVKIGPHSRMPPIPPVEPEKPPSHFEPGFLSDHKFEVRKDPEACNTCHRPFFCQACHQKRLPSSHDQNWLKFHIGNAAEQPKMCRSCHDDSYCADCHQKMRHDTAWITDHGKALEEWGHLTRWSEKTGLALCYQCHSKVSCDQCHQGAVPDNHRQPDFFRRHGEWVRVNPQKGNPEDNACTTCHAQQFCTNCHQERARPLSHQSPDYLWKGSVASRKGRGKSGHAREALQKGSASCATCHQPFFCTNCHGLPLPHGKNFLSIHSKEGAQNPSLCQRCHGWEDQECAQCHQRTRPRSHTPNYKKEHSRDPTLASGSCQVCHGKNACADCHRLPMPHPPDFIHTHGALARDRGITGAKAVSRLRQSLCSHCHTASYCRKCHLPDD
ncbi:MAG: cytochrome b N-terminal domain-containing protein [Armatimonadetes bacterium]|nr:cytochrome b N-terminal domain-containing protein [Armatimonadota bacterium]MDW8121700.1 cytochrome b N-terminal domain-containing protein [Armatimonadota bacterium]